MTICKNIVKGRVVFPEYITDSAVKELILGLLTRCVCGLASFTAWVLCGWRWVVLTCGVLCLEFVVLVLAVA